MDMPRPHLPFLQKERNPRNKAQIIWYVRLDRETPRIRIRGEYGSPEFMEAYRRAMAGEPQASKRLSKPSKGTLCWLCDRWRESSKWHQTAKSTQRQRDNILKGILDAAGDEPYSAITKAHVIAGRERRMATPFAANNYLKTLKALFSWAKSADLIAIDPAVDVEPLSRATEGHAPWTEHDLAAYRATHKIGTRARLAMELLYHTGLRRGDVVRLGKPHLGKDKIARIRAEKTGEPVSISFTQELLVIVSNSPIGEMTFITGPSGMRQTKEAFGNDFRKWCRAAGVTKSAHGLRKLAATEVAEGGGSEMELQAMFGWRSDDQSSVYTRSAKRDLLARQAAAKRVTK